MPFDGNGHYNPPAPAYPAIPDTVIKAEDFNEIIADIAAALATCMTRDGQTGVIANINFGGNKIVNLAVGTADSDAVTFAQVFKNPEFLATTLSGFKVVGTTMTLGVALVDMSASTAARLPADTQLMVNAALTKVLGKVGETGTIDFTAATLNVATAAPGTTGPAAASLDFVLQTAFATALPLQTGKSGGIPMTLNGVTSWVRVWAATTAATIAAAHGGAYAMADPANAQTLQLPAAPAAGTTIWLKIANGRYDNVVARNGKQIEGLAEDMTVDSAAAPICLVYIDNTLQWRIA